MIDLEKEEHGIKGKRVYIAAPYTYPDPTENVFRAVQAGLACIKAGHFPFIPHLFHFADVVEPQTYDTWIKQDLEWLEICELLVRLPGESLGADAEVRRAIELSIPVYHGMEQFLYHWNLADASR